MLSCDRIESVKFIHGTLSLAKLVYYNREAKCVMSSRLDYFRGEWVPIWKEIIKLISIIFELLFFGDTQVCVSATPNILSLPS